MAGCVVAVGVLQRLFVALAGRHVAGLLLLGVAFGAVAEAHGEGDAFAFDVDFQHFDFDHVAGFDHFARVFDVLAG